MDSATSPKSKRKHKGASVAASSSTSSSVLQSSKSKSTTVTTTKPPQAVGLTGNDTDDVECEWDNLPVEIASEIIKFLYDDIPSLLSLSEVSSNWREIGKSDLVWKDIFQLTFYRLEPSDKHFLETGVPLPTLVSKSASSSSTSNQETEISTKNINDRRNKASYYQLFSSKYSLHRRWINKQFTTNCIKPTSENERFSMLITWRGYVVSASGGGQITIWHPKNFSNTSTSKGSGVTTANKLKPWRTINAHQYHIWWMTIIGDLCFTVSSDGTFKVTNLTPLIEDQNAQLDTVIVVAGLDSIWCIDVDMKSRRAVIGCQEGTICLFSFKKKNWKKWKLLRTIRMKSGIWDVCLLPNKQFAACCNVNIAIFNDEPSQIERELDAETPPVPVDGAILGVNRRNVATPVDMQLPPPGVELANRPKFEGLVRNLNLFDGLLICACSNIGIEAWDLETKERVWVIESKHVDIFDVGQVNNKLIAVGTDVRTGFSSVFIYDRRTRELIFEQGPENSIGRVFSTCVTDESIYVCAVDCLYHINFAPQKSTKENQSCVVS